MKRAVPIILWSVVLSIGLVIVVKNFFYNGNGNANAFQPMDGRAFVETSWNYFPQVKPFELTDQTGDTMNSSELAGKPYAISFFFSQCPTICAQLNRKVQTLVDNTKNENLTFLSITCDPKNDTTEVLSRYAENFEADVDRWKFLTGQMYKIQEIGRNFDVVLDLNSHTDDILLVDKWGRYRDRFKWDDPKELARFEMVADQLLSETQPPLGTDFRTRNALAGVPHKDRQKSWLDEFFLTDHDGRQFYSRDWTGDVWIGSLFFTNCTQVCRKQNEYLGSLQDRLGGRRLKFASISTDPKVDTPEVLRQYRATLGIQDDNWKFLTGDPTYVRKVSEEFFRAPMTAGQHHSTKLFVVDRWGIVRGSFDWQEEGSESEMLALVDLLLAENSPNDRFQSIAKQ